ncbi:putative disease resistance protein RGA3 [Senna tora]|uniref:Putative disease resistance protein RGA3 n=1 Tax=Senna tora TaxID=362788 RepID=A0A834SWN0_9FABA|nr:putative disease resistance protein RGA3 [Senna tora]
MAEAVIEVLLENLSSLIKKELGLFLGVHQEMKRLSSILTTIKAVIEDAEEKRFTNKALQNWLHKLQDAAHLLDDILDEYFTQSLGIEYQGLKFGSTAKVQCSCLSSFHSKDVLFHYKIAKKMKDIRVRLDEIAEERLKFHLREVVTERVEIMEWRQTTSVITQPQVYGREEDKEKIVDFLVDSASDFEDVPVYPIVEDFKLKRMIKAIIESTSRHACEDLDLEPLQGRLQDLLRRKRYLLVLDDVWNEDQEKWFKLKYILACGSKGASILVTTRLTKVASIMGTTHPHQLSMLSDDNCWEVFKHRAFGPDKGECTELVDIGKEIVKKCKGVPLAAKALGSLLRFKSEEKDWLYVKESKIWSLPQDENSILPALKLSYWNLPMKLRQCFSFCALFPKNEEINKQFVIHLWMANGFISSNERLEVEDIGDEVCNELYCRSFFDDTKTDEFGNITSFKMHDLVHDLAQSVMEDVCSCITIDNTATNLSEKTRHLSHYSAVTSNGQPSLNLHQFKSLKSYITPMNYSDCLPPDILMKCYSLRVVDIMHLKEVSSSIGHLKHLRYLNLSHGRFETLPDSICMLWNLQILRLDYCCYLRNLPNHLKYLKSLRHLYLEGCLFLSSLAPEMGQLSSLRTLNIYIVGKKKGFLLAELKHLNLKGKLHVKNLERVSSVMDAKEANLGGKDLKHLQLSWEKNEESQKQKNVEKILEELQPHMQLKILEVEAYMGVQFPQWMGNPTLKDLYLIELVDCKNCLHLPLLGKLPSLKKLKIHNMIHVQYLDDESYDGEVERGFKALETLKLYKLPNLVRLSKQDGENMFPCLSMMEISQCPKLTLPCLLSVTELRILERSNQLLLASIPNLCKLESLWFRCNKELTSFEDGMLRGLTCLKELHICDYTKLEVLPIELINSNALEELHIELCHSLEPLTEQVLQQLKSLKRLKIGWYPQFKFSAGFQFLTSLEDLIIGSCPEVEGIHEALQHITNLQTLCLFDLPNLSSLPEWLGNLELLKSLFISECPKLMQFPNSIQYLRNLKILHIHVCPELQRRSEKETGEDWHKIAHVPSIYTGSQSFLPDGYFGPRWFTTDLLFD